MRVRSILDNPLPNSPDFDQLFRIAIAEEQDFRNEMNNSSVAWSLQSTTVNYRVGQDTYDLNVNDFGKALYVLRATENCQIKWLPVPIDDVEDLRYGTLLGAYFGSYGIPWLYGMNETLEHMSFFRGGDQASQPMVRIQPEPATNAEYVVHYQPGHRGDDDALTSEVTLPEHVELLRLRQAMASLAYAKWHTDEAENRIRRQELAASFAMQMQRKEQTYREYIATMSHSRDVTLDYWN